MKQNSSSRRVNEQARQVIAEILMFDISDPRLMDITITGCEVSFDRTSCNVFYTTDPDDYQIAQESLERAAGRIRSVMAKKLSWRVAPELRFHLDKTVDQAQRIAEVLAQDALRMPFDDSNTEAVAQSSQDSEALASTEKLHDEGKNDSQDFAY